MQSHPHYEKRRSRAGAGKAIAYGGPVVLDCQIDQDDKVFPMVPAGAAIDEVFDEDDLNKNK